jgi:uracil phosphoribosyltransferase
MAPADTWSTALRHLEHEISYNCVNPLRVQRVTIVDHPAVADRLARARERATPTPSFRRAVEEMGVFLAYEATRGLALEDVTVETPVAPAAVRRLGTRPVVAPILRAGLGLLPGFLSVIDDAVVAHLGFFRDPETLAAVPYYANLPADLSGRAVFALDPMLATGNSGAAALDVLTARGATDVSLLCILAAPEGIAYLERRHPSARIFTCALDERLNEHGYIVPGLGDAGDRMFGSASSVPAGYRPGHARNT